MVFGLGLDFKFGFRFWVFRHFIRSDPLPFLLGAGAKMSWKLAIIKTWIMLDIRRPDECKISDASFQSQPGLTISAKFRRNFGKFFVSISGRKSFAEIILNSGKFLIRSVDDGLMEASLLKVCVSSYFRS